MTDAGAMRWSGTIAAGAEQTFATPTVVAGTYTVTMTGTGDADLYVQIGAVPTTGAFACRSFGATSNETCTVTLTTARTVNVLVKGSAATSSFTVTVERR